MRTTIVALAENKLITTNRIVSLLRGRGVGVVALTFARTQIPEIASVTITVEGDRVSPQRVSVLLAKLKDVWQVRLVDTACTRAHEIVIVETAQVDDVLATARRIGGCFASVFSPLGAAPLVVLVADAPDIDTLIAALQSVNVGGLARVGPIVMPPRTGFDRRAPVRSSTA